MLKIWGKKRDPRLEANLRVLRRLEEVAREYPDLRFCQLLDYVGLTGSDNYYEEPTKTLERIENNIKQRKI